MEDQHPLPPHLDSDLQHGLLELLKKGNLTPPISIYNTSLVSSVITISGLPLGLIAIFVNVLLMYSILKSSHRPPNYILYFHLAFCDLLNGTVGIVTASFMLQNLRSPIDPGLAQSFCRIFAPLPTCVIRLLLYVMTVLAVMRMHIVCKPNARLSPKTIYFLTGVSYVFAVSLIIWLNLLQNVKVMALPDGWCIYYDHTPSTTHSLYIVYLIIMDAGPVLACSSLIIVCLVVVFYRVDRVSVYSRTASQDFGGEGTEGDQETYPLLLQSTARTFQVAKSIVNQVLIIFILCYSASIYIEIRNMVMALGGPNFEYVNFPDKNGPPIFNEFNLVVFRLKFSLTIIFSIANPLLVFRGSTVFRSNLGNLLEFKQFSYVITHGRNS